MPISKLKKAMNRRNISWVLVLYDLIILLTVFAAEFIYYRGSELLTIPELIWHVLLAVLVIFVCRNLFGVYKQIWRYGGIQSYFTILGSSFLGFFVYFLIQKYIPFFKTISFARALGVAATDTLLVLSMRMAYRYAYKCGGSDDFRGKVCRFLLRVMTRGSVMPNMANETQKIRTAIVGAGTVGISLAEDMLAKNQTNIPVAFIDKDPVKIGKYIHELPVLDESRIDAEFLESLGIQEIVFAISNTDPNTLKKLYERYSPYGRKIWLYDFLALESIKGGQVRLREFDIEDLLFRKVVEMKDERTEEYFKDKVVLITGGGGSIGSELCRQLARMAPKQIIIAEIYENGAYDVQQELRLRYGRDFDIRIEIVSVVDKVGLERVFAEYHPQVVINAAAHKHVPLMEKNCIECVKNNVFGTLNSVELAEQYGAEKFIQVSTDKAVNPTNVMGASKRMCELIVMSHAAAGSRTSFSATRFGNVIGSAGSVIPLFRRQIAAGGPVTVTDKRIIRYFMTIPEASQLVLQSGAMAKNGELFVLDMGKPVKILDLAENMIRLAGLVPDKDIKIEETGLRPGEKLYEELLIQSETLTKTDNSLIFIEKDDPITFAELNKSLDLLRKAIERNSDEGVKLCLQTVVPTYVPNKQKQLNMSLFSENEEESVKQKLESLQGKKVLIVDDVVLNRNIAEETLREIGMRTESVSGGSEAIDRLKEKGPDAWDFLLLDYSMPSMSGAETARAVRQIPGFSNLRIVGMMADADQKETEKALQAGINNCILKPVHLDELINAFSAESN